MKQLRIDFPDYSAKEQAADAKKSQGRKLIRHAYLLKVDGIWSHFIIGPGPRGEDVGFYDGKELIDVCKELKQNYPDYTPKVIINEGLENYLRDEKARRSQGQLKFNFKEEISR